MKQHSSAARERMRASVHPVYASHILEPIFEFNCRYNFYPLLDAHRAWLVMLAERKLVPQPDAAAIFRALDELEKTGPDALRPFNGTVEFYYLHMERALVARVPGGEAVVGNLNLGRTRPEPLHRMVLRERLLHVLDDVLKTRQTLLERADAEAETVMPGYTHLLHAQPTTLGHYLAAIHDHLMRDTQRLLAAHETIDRCTLGCGAMSGTSLPIDRQRVRELLGFSALCENTLDSVSATDHVAEAAAALAGVMTVIGRLAQDLYIFSSQEFGMIDVTDSFASPSSLMPQKKNALVLEYIRARTAQTIGALTSCLTVMHNVGYMDTEDVEFENYRPLFDALTHVDEALPTMQALLEVMRPERQLMRERAASGFSSVTALAEAIQTREKVSYRSAHRVVARAVLLAVERGRDATGIDVALLNDAARETLGRELALDALTIGRALDPRQFVQHHAGIGATAPSEVRRMLAARREALAHDREEVASRRKRLESAKKLLRSAGDALTRV